MNTVHCLLFTNKAERVGFEPTVTVKATTLFESAPINRSGTSPFIDFVIFERTAVTTQPLHRP